MARHRTSRVVVAVLIVLAVAVGIAVAVPLAMRWQSNAERDAARRAVEQFARAWRTGALASVPFDGATSKDAAGRIAAATAALTPGAADRPTAVDVLSVTDPDHARASGQLRVRWTLDGGRAWSYQTTAGLHKLGGHWTVVWAPTLVHPSLHAGQTLAVTRTAATRGRILGARGVVLAGLKDVVDVGIQPGATQDRAAAAEAVARIVDVDAGVLTRAVKAAPAAAFVEVITLRAEAYAPLAGRLKAVRGVVTRPGTLTLGRTAQFARALLGSVGPATQEIVSASDGRVRAGDIAGLTGLQRTYDARLAGTPGLVVRAVNASTGTTLYDVPPVAGQDVTTTLDPAVQDAAEAALGAATKPAALVAVRPSTGDLLAVANGGPNAAGYDRALLGQYPPGSTFKIVSGYALLRQGYTATTPVPCPSSVTVDGLTIGNAENEVLGTVPFRTDFAQSCNAAFVGSRGKVTPQQLADAAAALGYGEPGGLGVQAFGGTVPTSGSEVEHAVDMIGQGKVLTSPLTVATVTASVAAGSRVTPRLVLDPPPAAGASLPASASGPALDGTTLATLRDLMRAVVTDGTGTALADVPGGPVRGKTGTAEFGTRNPPDTHAWFTGYQGDVAFAVIVEGGGFGAKVAAPIAADFLGRLS
ncbi:MAG: penicillin-binding transpeptidase domain-containing protein [Kineosporiaceae bacterium]